VIRNQAGQSVGAQMTTIADGSDFTAAVTVYVTLDNGTLTLGSVGSGIATHEGHGYHTYVPSQAETNAATAAYTFAGTGAITVTKEYETITTAQAAALAQAPLSGPLVYVSDVCTASLQRLGLIAAGETATSADLTLALTRLNTLIDSWRTNRLFTYSLTRTTFPLVSGTSSYTLGSTGTIALDRPVFPQYIRLIDTTASPTQEIPVRLLTDAAYAAIPQKSLTSTWPTGVYYNPTAPLATLTFWPIPTASTLQGVIYTPNPSGTLALTDILQVPPGYQLFYQDALAVHLATDFKVQASDELKESAREARSSVKRVNQRLTDMTVRTPFGPSGYYDITSDELY
jgi:hypothetical protein